MLAQVDPFHRFVNLLALLRPQIHEPACCEDSSTGGKYGAAFILSADKQKFWLILGPGVHFIGKQWFALAGKSYMIFVFPSRQVSAEIPRGSKSLTCSTSMVSRWSSFHSYNVFNPSRRIR